MYGYKYIHVYKFILIVDTCVYSMHEYVCNVIMTMLHMYMHIYYVAVCDVICT